MRFALYGLLIVSILMIILALYRMLFSSHIIIDAKVREIQDINIKTMSSENQQSAFYKKRILPRYDRLTSLISSFVPKQFTKNIERNIVVAGSPYNLNADRFIFIQVMISMAIPIFLILIRLIFKLSISNRLILIIILLGLFIPPYLLKSMAKKRQDKIRNSLPEILDILYISVEAGLAFDMALKRTVDKMSGPLPEEFKQALDEISRGKVRSEALRGIVYRTDVSELASFVSAVIQSEHLGSNIAATLRVQSATVRQQRRQYAEEKAMKIPIKMLLPLVLFLFPALFIIILGPAAIQLLEMFAVVP